MPFYSLFNPASPPAIGSTTPAAGTFTTLTATGQTSLGGAAGANNFRVLGTAGTINYWQAVGGNGATTNPRLSIEGTSTNTSAQFASKGTGVLQFITNGASNLEQMRVAHTASAVNYVQVTGAATGNDASIAAQGSDTNIWLQLNGKGNRGVAIGYYTRIGRNFANYFEATGNNAGSSPIISVGGSDTNIDLALTPKGTGNVRFGTLTASADAAITGYITIKDSGGTVRKLAVIA